ncbi:type II secretion system protein GspD [Novipirellula sp. SH528]|uniref:type II secretion system protein GspD n=1 Tax=Novipirellula sp. SH528 TaxID=3454466 RepID=UPI003FA03FDA
MSTIEITAKPKCIAWCCGIYGRLAAAILVSGCGVLNAFGNEWTTTLDHPTSDRVMASLRIADVPDLVPIRGSGRPVIVKPEGRVLKVPASPDVSFVADRITEGGESPSLARTTQPDPASISSSELTSNEKSSRDPRSTGPNPNWNTAMSSDQNSPVPSVSNPLEQNLPAPADKPATSASATNESVGTQSIDDLLDRKGSITFRKTPLSEVIFLLSELWKVNIVAGDSITGDVSGTFYETPLREVLSAVLNSSGYSYRHNGSSLVVLPIDQVGTGNPDFVSRMIQMPTSIQDLDATIEAVQLLMSERGQIRKIGNGAILIVDRPERVKRVQELITSLSPQVAQTLPPPIDSPAPMTTQVVSEPLVTTSGIAYFTPQYTEAEEMTESLQAALGDNIVVATYAKENRIMVKGTPDQLRLAAQAIEQLDVPRAQVRITALIYDVSLKEAEGLGVNWSHGPHSKSTSLLNAGTDEEISVFRNAIEAGTDLGLGSPTSSLGFRTLNNSYDASVALQALSATSEAKILADPTVTVGDRCQASIKIVQRLPIVTSIVTSTGSIPQVEFEEAGIILNVTPRISRDGTIEMHVQPEYSVVAEYRDAYPVIDSRNAETTVRVGNGHLFAMGGLRQKNITETVRGVPYLKDVKYIGRLFRSHGTEVRESELIVFLKPEIISPYAPGTLRENQASCIANLQLDQIPYATVCPGTPDCRNPDCPNHHPRPRLNGGSVELEMIGGCGIGCLEPMNQNQFTINSAEVEVIIPSP